MVIAREVFSVKSKAVVFFGSTKTAKASADNSLAGKLQKILNELGLKEAVKGKKVVVKMHLGANLSFSTVHPFLAHLIIRTIKEGGGDPFIVNIMEQYKDAWTRGYTAVTLGCPIYPVAGPKDRYYIEKEVNYKSLKTIKMGGLMTEADVLVTVSHVKGHNTCGFGAAIKNLALGCYTQETRWGLHRVMQYDPYWFPAERADLKEHIEKLIKACPYGAIKYEKERLRVIFDICNQCMRCVNVDEDGCLKIKLENFASFQEAMSITTGFVLEHFDPENTFYINVALDITQYCDCWGITTGNILPDLGILGSKDIVAIDKASLDLLKNKPLIEENVSNNLEIIRDPRLHPFARIHGPYKDPYLQVKYCEERKLGTSNYEIIEVMPAGKRRTLPPASFPEPLKIY